MFHFSIIFRSNLKLINFIKSHKLQGTLCNVKQLISGNSRLSSTGIVTNSLKPVCDERNIFKSPYADVEILNDSLHQYVWRNIHLWWNKVALVCAVTGRTYTYGELRKLCGKFATSLRRRNLSPGDTVAVVLPNVPEYAIIVLGASEAGLRVTLINPAHTAHEMRNQLENSEATAVITSEGKYPVIMESIKSGNCSIRLPIIIVADGNDVPAGTISFKELIDNRVEEFDKTGEKLQISTEIDTFALPYSSGTTGVPKGVELTHRNLVANMCQLTHPDCSFLEAAVGNHQEVIPLILPLYHIYGLSVCLHATLSLGAKLICMPQFTSNNLLDVLSKHSISLFLVVPPIIQLIINDDKFVKEHLMNIKAVNSGAAPITIEFINQFRSKMGNHFAFNQGYGLTETSPIVALGKHTSPESSGFIAPNTEIRVIGQEDDRFGKNLGVNEVGEIAVRGPQIMKGYYKNPEATADCMDEEWFKTGDLGYIDEQGELYITGRLKELIKVQGSQVSPTELENVLHGHEKIADAAVVGVPHKKFGEIPKAFVVPKAGHKITEEEIKNFVAQRVAKYKQIGHVVFTDRILKSPAGKILRKDLQKL